MAKKNLFLKEREQCIGNCHESIAEMEKIISKTKKRVEKLGESRGIYQTIGGFKEEVDDFLLNLKEIGKLVCLYEIDDVTEDEKQEFSLNIKSCFIEILKHVEEYKKSSTYKDFGYDSKIELFHNLLQKLNSVNSYDETIKFLKFCLPVLEDMQLTSIYNS